MYERRKLSYRIDPEILSTLQLNPPGLGSPTVHKRLFINISSCSEPINGSANHTDRSLIRPVDLSEPSPDPESERPEKKISFPETRLT